MKVLISDSQSAVQICLADGGSWRTRHLRLRAAHARQRFVKGDWLLRHRAGEEMLADLGTKILASPRFEKLKTGLGMQKVLREEEVKDDEEEEKKRGSIQPNVPTELIRALQVLTLCAALEKAKAAEDGSKEEKAGEEIPYFQIFMMAYSLLIVCLTLLMNWMCRMGCRREKEKKDLDGKKTGAAVPGSGGKSPAPMAASSSSSSSGHEGVTSSGCDAGANQSAGSGNPFDGGGNAFPPPPPQVGGRRQRRPFVTHTGVCYHSRRACRGLRNAFVIEELEWCPRCGGMSMTNSRSIYTLGLGCYAHRRFYMRCEPDPSIPLRELRPCTICVWPEWPEDPQEEF